MTSFLKLLAGVKKLAWHRQAATGLSARLPTHMDKQGKLNGNKFRTLSPPSPTPLLHALQLFISAAAEELNRQNQHYEALRESIIDSRRVAMTNAELTTSSWSFRYLPLGGMVASPH